MGESILFQEGGGKVEGCAPVNHCLSQLCYCSLLSCPTGSERVCLSFQVAYLEGSARQPFWPFYLCPPLTLSRLPTLLWSAYVNDRGRFQRVLFFNISPHLGCRIMAGPLFWPLSLWVMSGILCILMRVSALCKKVVVSLTLAF